MLRITIEEIKKSSENKDLEECHAKDVTKIEPLSSFRPLIDVLNEVSKDPIAIYVQNHGHFVDVKIYGIPQKNLIIINFVAVLKI